MLRFGCCLPPLSTFLATRLVDNSCIVVGILCWYHHVVAITSCNCALASAPWCSGRLSSQKFAQHLQKGLRKTNDHTMVDWARWRHKYHTAAPTRGQHFLLWPGAAHCAPTPLPLVSKSTCIGKYRKVFDFVWHHPSKIWFDFALSSLNMKRCG